MNEQIDISVSDIPAGGVGFQSLPTWNHQPVNELSNRYLDFQGTVKEPKGCDRTAAGWKKGNPSQHQLSVFQPVKHKVGLCEKEWRTYILELADTGYIQYHNFQVGAVGRRSMVVQAVHYLQRSCSASGLSRGIGSRSEIKYHRFSLFSRNL